MRGSGCSHLDVKHRLDDLLGVCPGAKIESIQFVPLSVHLDTVNSDQRYKRLNGHFGWQLAYNTKSEQIVVYLLKDPGPKHFRRMFVLNMSQ